MLAGGEAVCLWAGPAGHVLLAEQTSHYTCLRVKFLSFLTEWVLFHGGNIIWRTLGGQLLSTLLTPTPV